MWEHRGCGGSTEAIQGSAEAGGWGAEAVWGGVGRSVSWLSSGFHQS